MLTFFIWAQFWHNILILKTNKQMNILKSLQNSLKHSNHFPWRPLMILFWLSTYFAYFSIKNNHLVVGGTTKGLTIDHKQSQFFKAQCLNISLSKNLVVIVNVSYETACFRQNLHVVPRSHATKFFSQLSRSGRLFPSKVCEGRN